MADGSPQSWEETDLSVELQQLRSGLDELHAAMLDAGRRVGDLEEEALQSRDVVSGLEGRTGDIDAALRDLSGLLKRLDARVEWLERNIRLSDTAAVVELDDAHPGLVRLAAEAESGLSAQHELLAAAARERLQEAIERHAAAGRQHAGQLQAALAASLTVADTAYPGEEHAEAVEVFRTAVSAMDAAAGAVTANAADARESVQRLQQDDERRDELADRIAAGRSAWQQLLAILRRRLADAVGEGALLPTWFTTVLGPIPPADDTREWMEVGTELLAYRVSYQVSDPVVALGFEPSERDSARRRDWHHRLKRHLRDIQR